MGWEDRVTACIKEAGESTPTGAMFRTELVNNYGDPALNNPIECPILLKDKYLKKDEFTTDIILNRILPHALAQEEAERNKVTAPVEEYPGMRKSSAER